ncbi:MAG: hypothetical protein ACXV3V_10915 [Actinomycetes bacterium]
MRLSIGSGAEDAAVMVTDGSHSMTVNPSEHSFEADTASLPAFVVHEDNRTLASWCADAKAIGVENVQSRATTRYRCTDQGQESMFHAQQLWVDRDTSLVLQWVEGNLRATPTAVDVHAALAADAFSMRSPAGARDSAHPEVAPFRVPGVGGGDVAWADYRGDSVVIVAGNAPGIRATVARLLPMTAAGSSPRLLGLLKVDPPDNWRGSLLNPHDVAALATSVAKRAGRFDVPVGIDFKGAAEASITASLKPRPESSAIVLVRRDGTIERVTDDDASDSDLRSWIRHLR